MEENPTNFILEKASISIPNYYNDIIILVFLIAGLCVGLPALLWASYILYTHLKNGGGISHFVLFLLINNLSELLLSAFIVTYLFSVTDSITTTFHSYHIKGLAYLKLCIPEWGLLDACYVAAVLWDALKIGGLYLHQLVALDSVLSLRKQLRCSHIFSQPCSTVSGLILWLVGFGCQLLRFEIINLISCLLPVCVLAATCILTCKFPPTPGHVTPTDMKPGSSILIVSSLTLIAYCVQFIVAFHFKYMTGEETHLSNGMLAFLVNLRLISDPFLCVLVCKLNIRFQTAQTIQEFSSDQQSV